ncbi:MAG: transposase, partial [Cyclobacteriaceae bacterium]|nr:transposase [Cyclobacteriaceae bacterium]
MTENIEFNRKNFQLLIQEYQKISTELDRLEKVFSDLQAKYQLTKDDLDYLKRQLFGRKSERFVSQDPGQLSLELEQMAEALQEQATEKVEYERKKAKAEKKPGHGRMLLPSHLRREETIIEPENLPEGSKKIGEEITEILEYKKAEIFVKKFIRPKYVLPGEEGVKVANLPSLPIPKGNAGPGLLSHILISKYVDHL